jgi:hypothetical protein
VRFAGAVEQGRIAGRAGIRMQGLQRVDQHAGDIATRPQHLECGRVHVFERIGFARLHRIAHAGLHIAPPTVIRAAESHQMRALRVIARQPHGLHDRFRAGHVERDFIESRNREQAPDILRSQRVIGAQHRPQLTYSRGAGVDAFFVKIVSEYIDAVRARDIVKAVSVEVSNRHAARGLNEGAGPQVLPDVAAELERHAVAGREFKIRNAALKLGGLLERVPVSRGEEFREPGKAGAARRDYRRRRGIDAKEAGIVVLIERHPGGEAARHARMARQRAVLGQGELQPDVDFSQQECEDESAQNIAKGRNCLYLAQPARRGLYCRPMTLR